MKRKEMKNETCQAVGFLAVLVCLLGLATACGESAEAPAVSSEPASSLSPHLPAPALCRVVAGAEENNLLLADLEGSGEIYRLSLEGLTVQDEEGKPAQPENGMEVRVEYSGEENLTSPATFREPTALTVTGEKKPLLPVPAGVKRYLAGGYSPQ